MSRRITAAVVTSSCRVRLELRLAPLSRSSPSLLPSLPPSLPPSLTPSLTPSLSPFLSSSLPFLRIPLFTRGSGRRTVHRLTPFPSPLPPSLPLSLPPSLLTTIFSLSLSSMRVIREATFCRAQGRRCRTWGGRRREGGREGGREVNQVGHNSFFVHRCHPSPPSKLPTWLP